VTFDDIFYGAWLVVIIGEAVYFLFLYNVSGKKP
jgi:hypothetical protein